MFFEWGLQQLAGFCLVSRIETSSHRRLSHPSRFLIETRIGFVQTVYRNQGCRCFVKCPWVRISFYSGNRMGLVLVPFPCAKVFLDQTQVLQGPNQDWLWYKLSLEPGFLSHTTLCYWSTVIDIWPTVTLWGQNCSFSHSPWESFIQFRPRQRGQNVSTL
jgi:hypothetical protein